MRVRRHTLKIYTYETDHWPGQQMDKLGQIRVHKSSKHSGLFRHHSRVEAARGRSIIVRRLRHMMGGPRAAVVTQPQAREEEGDTR